MTTCLLKTVSRNKNMKHNKIAIFKLVLKILYQILKHLSSGVAALQITYRCLIASMKLIENRLGDRLALLVDISSQ